MLIRSVMRPSSTGGTVDLSAIGRFAATVGAGEGGAEVLQKQSQPESKSKRK